MIPLHVKPVTAKRLWNSDDHAFNVALVISLGALVRGILHPAGTDVEAGRDDVYWWSVHICAHRAGLQKTLRPHDGRANVDENPSAGGVHFFDLRAKNQEVAPRATSLGARV